MEDTVSGNLEQLRKRSRTLLAQVDENIQRLNSEIRRYRSEISLLNQNNLDIPCEKVPSTKKSLRSWKLRNDSTAISRVLCPDYSTPSSSDISASMPDILPSRNIVLTSTKGNKYQRTKDVQWKPVKGCYCNTVFNKAQPKSTKRVQKYGDVCDQFKNQTEFCSVVQGVKNTEILTPPISCETLRRVQKIDYTPKSQFLRNVQSTVSQLQSLPMGSPLEGCVRSSCYHKLMADNKRDTAQHTVYYSDIKKAQQTEDNLRKSRLTSQVPANVETSEDDENFEYHYPAKSSRDICVVSRKQINPRFIIKKTLVSKKSVPELKKERIVRTPKNKRSKEAPHCPCCTRSFEKSPRTVRTESTKVVYCNPTVCKNYDYEEVDEVEEVERIEKVGEMKELKKKYFPGNDVRDINKFREQNYFDTHGSRHTLVSSSSSGSLEHCLLNKRLFAEPVGRIHKKDVVVTVPPCATVQRKRMHYFPRYIVRQKKADTSTNHKKRRCQTCPLTGHAIDLGILKVQPPINSLALKYQKHTS